MYKKECLHAGNASNNGVRHMGSDCVREATDSGSSCVCCCLTVSAIKSTDLTHRMHRCIIEATFVHLQPQALAYCAYTCTGHDCAT